MKQAPSLALAALAVALSFAVSPCLAFGDRAYEDANQSLLRASAGDKSQIEGAVEKFGALYKAEPTHPLLLAKLGAATAMQARTTMLPWKKISYAEDGMAMQDKALALLTPALDTELHAGVPVSLQVRFTTASTFLDVPSMFNRGATGEKLLDNVLKSPLFAATPNTFKAAVWMRAARLAEDQKRIADAKNFYEMVKKTDTPLAETAHKQLATLQ